mgnify:CR=1 FL=1
MGDIFPKDGRFIATGPFDAEMPHYYIIIRDYRWWNDNEKEIYRWMDDCLPRGRKHQQGMVVVIEDESDASNFLLRWS